MKGGRGDIIPTTLLNCPPPPTRIFRLSYGPVVCYAAMQFMTYLQTTSWKNCPFQVKISKSAWQTFVNVANAHVMSICMDLATQSQSCMWAILGFRINVLRPLYTLIYFLKGIQLRCTLIKKIVAYFRCFLYTYLLSIQIVLHVLHTNFSSICNIGSGDLCYIVNSEGKECLTLRLTPSQTVRLFKKKNVY